MSPILKLNVSGHIDRITGMDYYSKGDLAFTGSDDGTVRVWDVFNKRLRNTLRIPAAEFKEGEIYSLSVNPVSGLLAVGGWTGIEWNGLASVYIIDPDESELFGRIVNLPDRILSLEFSPNGSRLAISLMNGELKLYHGSDFSLIAENHLCKGISHRISFSSNNRFVSNCFDGVIRVYDDNLDLVYERIFPDRKPSGVSFHPSGNQIAVAFFDSPEILLLSAETLETIHRVDTRIANNSVLRNIVWSGNGEVLFGGGDLERNGQSYIAMWDSQGFGEPELVEAGSGKIFRLHAVRSDLVAFTTVGHTIGVVGDGGREIFRNESPIVQFLGKEGKLKVSRDGSKIAFPFDNVESSWGNYDGVNSRYTNSDRSEVSGDLSFPVRRTEGIEITNWKHSKAPALNGVAIELYPNQESHDVAIAPNGEYFAMALDGELRSYTADGRLIWSNTKTSGPFSVNVSGDSQTIVAGMQDGSIRWFEAQSGKEYFAFFPHANRTDWVAWLQEGFYVSSPEGDKNIGWHLNNGEDQLADFYTAWQFEKSLFRPDLVAQPFISGKRHGFVADEAAGIFTASDIRDAAPPDVDVRVIQINAKEETAKIEISSQKRTLSIDEYAVYVNGIPVTPFANRQVSLSEVGGFTHVQTIPYFDIRNDVRVEVLTNRSIGIGTAFIDGVEVNPDRENEKGDLYLLAIGVNELKYSQRNSLGYAAQDAEGIAAYLEPDEGELYNNVYVRVLSDFSDLHPTKENIEASLDFFQVSGPNDTSILFLAAHGVSNTAGDYFFIPRDASSEDIDSLSKNLKTPTELRSFVRWDKFFSALRQASGKRLLFVDTCQAKQIEGTFDVQSLAKRSAAASFALLAASKENEVSQEYASGGHGLFTYGVLDGLKGGADINGDGQIGLGEVYSHAEVFVQKNRFGGWTQTPQLIAPEFLFDMPLVNIENVWLN